MSLSIAAVLAQADLPASDTALLDAELLLAHVLGKPRTYLKTWPERELDTAQRQAFEALLARRRAGEPVAYLLGQQGFWSLDLQVSPATLIPRPDTERLVEVALQIVLPGNARVLDLGTGTGAIALALATERGGWRVTGCDFLQEAIELAERNRQRNGIDNASFIRSDWFSGLAARRFDLIVSNPPYIASDDPHLAQGDLRFEPASALVSGTDGLTDLRHIIERAPHHLESGGWVLLEHGWEQGGAVREMLSARGFRAVASSQDLAGHERISGGQWHE